MGRLFSILLTSSNSGLSAGAILMFLGTIMFAGLAIYKFVHFFKSSTTKERVSDIASGIIGLGFVLFFGHGFLLEYNLLTNSVYVEGTTLKYCSPGKGQGIEFEYYVNGQRYTNCNSYKDIEQIKVPGGKFKVRVSDYDPTIGRIDFESPMTSDSRTSEVK